MLPYTPLSPTLSPVLPQQGSATKEKTKLLSCPQYPLHSPQDSALPSLLPGSTEVVVLFFFSWRALSEVGSSQSSRLR